MSDDVKRGEGGRFLPGTKPGPGRPKRPVRHDFFRALADEVTMENWREAVHAVVAKAKEGDLPAFRALAAYLVGAPSVSAPSIEDLARGEDEGEPMNFDAAERLLREFRGATPPPPVGRRLTPVEDLAVRTERAGGVLTEAEALRRLRGMPD